MIEYLDRIFLGTAREYEALADKALQEEKKLFIVTANPEILMMAEKDETARTLLLDERVSVVPDGISVVKALRSCGYPAKERITGVDLLDHLLQTCGEAGKSVYLLGAKEEVVSALAKKISEQYPKAAVSYHNGYEGNKDEIFQEIAALSPDLIVVGLGAPAQEKLIYKHYESFSKGVMIGVGGSFDVLSGSKRRAPTFFIRTNTEWLYRILREPSRLGRFYRSNVKFLGQAKKAARDNDRNL